MLAASLYISGMAWRPAMKMIIVFPQYAILFINVIMITALIPWLIQSTLATPKSARISLRAPRSYVTMKYQI